MIQLLSIIIPVYNCSPVILRCLDSIDYQAAEVIVVDDGSTDDSAEVVRSYIASHPNVRLIQKKNGGVSSARNVGIEAASGKYLMFVDADDYLVPDGIERALNMAEANEADVLKFGYYCLTNDARHDSDSVKDVPCSLSIIEGRFEALMHNDVPDYLVWDGLFLRSAIEKNGIRFHEDMPLHEDDVFMGELYCHVDRIVVTDLPVYRYVVSSNQSSTHCQRIDKQRQLINSSCLAIRYRGEYVKKYCPEAMPLERLKYMRWVCTPKTAIQAGCSLQEYKVFLSSFKELGCWPLDYRWIHAARLDWSWKVRMKNRAKTFLCNHPGFAYLLLRRKNETI